MNTGFLPFARRVVVPVLWFLTITPPARCAPPPLAWWRFDEGAGRTIADASGHSRTGTVVGPLVWTNGVAGKALHFGGSTRVTVPVDAGLLLGSGLTLQAFIRPVDYQPATYKHLVELWDSYLLRFDTPAEGGNLSFFTFLDGTPEPRLSGGIPEPGQWHQVFAVWTGTNMQLWVDGLKLERARPGNPAPRTNQLSLGRSFIGAMDEVKIYDRALTENELLNEMAPLARASLSVPRPVLEIGQVFTVSCLVSNQGGQALTNGVATLSLPAGLALVGGVTPTNIPPVSRGAPVLLQWQVRAAAALADHVAVRVQFGAPGDYDLAAPVVAARTIPSPVGVPAGPVLTSLGNDLVLGNGAVRLVFSSNDFGHGVCALDVHQSNVWRRLGVANAFSRLAVKSGSQVARRLVHARNHRVLAPAPGSAGVEFTNRISDGAGTLWSCRFSFVLSNDNRILIRHEAIPDGDGLLALLQGPTLYAGEGGFGAVKDDALFCGLEWLVGEEASSSNLDMHDPGHYVRFVPHPHKITIPLMAVSRHAAAAALYWNGLQTWDATNTQPAAVFASPNFLEGQDNHLLGLFLPSVPQWTRQNQREAVQNPYPFRGGVPLRLEAWLAAVTPATQAVECLPLWFETFGVPAPAPLPRLNYTNEVDFSMRAFLEALWDPVEQKWWTSKGGPEEMSYLARPPSYTFQLRMAALLTPHAQNATQYLDRAALGEQLGGFRASWDDLGFTWANPLSGLSGARARASSLLDSMGADGAWRFRARIETNGIFAGRDYGLLGPDNAAEVGTCARNAYDILRYVRMTGDAEAFSAAQKALAFMDQFTVPRAAQVWECPVHSPDILAAADAMDAYLEAFRYSGEPHFLDRAVFWAWRGLPFIYMWNPEGRPILRHASIAIYGGSWFEGSWIGQPVQWNGLRYAYALLKLAEHDASFPWATVAEGITRSAIYQQDDSGTNVALWPDNFSALDWTKCPWVFEPGQILKNVFKMLGRDVEPATTSVGPGGQRLFVTSRAAITGAAWVDDRLTFRARFPDGESGHVVVASVWKPSAVLLNGSSVLETSGDLWAVATNAWTYDSASGVAVMRLVGSGPHDLEVPGARYRPGTLIPPVATAIEFDFDSGTGGWLPANQITSWTLEGGWLRGAASGSDPYLHRTRLRVDGSRCTRIAVRSRASAGNAIALYWTTEDSPAWAEAKSIHLTLRPGTNFTQYLFEVGKHALWAGKTITAIRLDPLEGGGGGTFDIDYIRGDTPRLTPGGFQGNHFRLFLEGIPGLSYQVEASSNLQSWWPRFQVVPQALSTPLSDTNALLAGARFYRAQAGL